MLNLTTSNGMNRLLFLVFFCLAATGGQAQSIKKWKRSQVFEGDLVMFFEKNPVMGVYNEQNPDETPKLNLVRVRPFAPLPRVWFNVQLPALQLPGGFNPLWMALDTRVVVTNKARLFGKASVSFGGTLPTQQVFELGGQYVVKQFKHVARLTPNLGARTNPTYISITVCKLGTNYLSKVGCCNKVFTKPLLRAACSTCRAQVYKWEWA